MAQPNTQPSVEPPAPPAGPFPTSTENLLLDVVAELEPGLNREAILAAIGRACSNRAKRRRLATAVTTEPGVLTSGRPDGPVAVDHLIHELLAHGAQHVQAPICPACGHDKPLSERWNDTRICQPCKLQRRRTEQPCEKCGRPNYVGRDREGRRVCRKCRPGQDVDPVEVLTAQVAHLAPGVAPSALREAIRGIAKAPYDLLKASWEVEDRPGLLTGEGEHGSTLVIRLIAALIAAGAVGVVAPACPRCSRTVPLTNVRDGLRVCDPCYRKTSSAPACASCGNHRSVSGRDAHGRPLCSVCYNLRPENHITCIQCGQTRNVGRRTPDGPLCKQCYRLPIAICVICGNERHCVGASTGMPCCQSCKARKQPCVRCGKTLQPAARVPEGHLCHTCWAKEPTSFKTCTSCGTVAHLHHHGLCAGCACDWRARELLAGPDGALRDSLAPVHQALTGTSDPRSVMRWLNRSNSATAVLRELGTPQAPLDHATLDPHTPNKSIEHLRAVLVAAGVLPPRDERLAALQRWIDTKISEAEPGDRKLLRAFTTWNQLGRLRSRANGKPITAAQAITVRQNVRAALRLLAWLHDHEVSLAECTQRHIDAWIEAGTSTQLHGRPFVQWAVSNHHAHQIEVPAPSRLHPTPPLDDEARWALARQLLHDDAIELADRVAGLLVLLYAQPITTIARIRADQVTHASGTVQLHLSEAPLDLPEPLAVLVTDLLAARRSRSVIARGTSDWLLPGVHADRHISEHHLGTRLKRLGIYAHASRNAALRDLVGQLPVAVLARLLGISVNAAARWQRRNNAGWTGYAAEVSRR